MKADEITEAAGTFYHGTRAEFDFSQIRGGTGFKSFDRILGPHFSRTPDIASKFALYNPQQRGRSRREIENAKIFPVHIPGEIHRINQRGMDDITAVGADAFKLVVEPDKKFLDHVLLKMAQDDVTNLGGGDDPHGFKAEHRVKSYHQYIAAGRYDLIGSVMSYLNDKQLLDEIAVAYKNKLMDAGIGLIEYRNTNRRETRGMQSNLCYIALAQPVSVFDKTGQVTEGWRDWVTAAGIGAMAAGIGGAAYDNLVGPGDEPAQQIQPAAPTQEIQLQKLKPVARILAKTAIDAGIHGDELKQLLAQCAHETMDFSALRELGSDRYIMRKYDKKYHPTKAKQLGNTVIGDGLRYLGRGFIQLTGRYNYAKVGEALGLPLEAHPEMVEKPEIAAKVAVWFWQNRVAPKVSDFTNVSQATRPINPGMHGMKSRQEKYDRYSQITPPVRKTS